MRRIQFELHFNKIQRKVRRKLKNMTGRDKMRFGLFFCMFVFVTGFFVFQLITGAFASEQVGSSPSSGSDSRLKTASAALTALGYGSTAAGAWGDWGTMWNSVYSAAQGPFNDAKVNGTKNGGGTGAISGFTKVLGGVDDYNNGGAIPVDSYQKTWTACTSGNSYCGTGRSVAEKQDPNTGLVWSPALGSPSTYTWYVANNCSNTDGNPCVKRSSGKTGCEGYDDNNWRLPYQKELMQSYIDGSYGNLTNANNSYNYWSSTSASNLTTYAWSLFLSTGYMTTNPKTGSGYIRCVR